MKERPILFSAPMVRAILAGRKTQTRRVVKPQPIHAIMDKRGWDALQACSSAGLFDASDERRIDWAWKGTRFMPWPSAIRNMSPYGYPHDRLWVKETFAEPHGRDGDVYYRADGPDRHDDGTWRPSIFMRREISRITLEIVAVRAERLQEITPEAVVSEGLSLPRCGCDVCRMSSAMCPADAGVHLEEFAALWDSINGEREGCSWDANPWVWVVSFKRIEKAEAA